jgi:hypothetical protein
MARESAARLGSGTETPSPGQQKALTCFPLWEHPPSFASPDSRSWEDSVEQRVHRALAHQHSVIRV